MTMNNIDKTTVLALALAAGESLKAPGFGWHQTKERLREVIAKDPLDALAVTVAGGALLFWIAERDVNPRCRRFEDALVFISTCLNVGYAQVFAVTPAGKAIATAVMTIGPAMAAAALSPPRAEQPLNPPRCEEEKASREIADKLDAILQELRAARAA
jgi:hypothetical protein